MQTIALVGNGATFDCATLLKTYHAVIALDGGYQFCQKLGVTPTVTLGDGDSIEQTPPNFVELPDQTSTDLQKGLQYVTHTYQDYVIDLFGCVGIDRLDHTLSAIHLLSHNPSIRSLYTPHQQLRLIRDECELNDIPSFSLVPMTAAANVVIEGAVWSGQFTLDQTYSGLSNQAQEQTMHITVNRGTVLVITPITWTSK